MRKFLFVLSRGPEDATRAVRCFQLAKIAVEKGHDVTVFLVDDAVYFTNLGMSERRITSYNVCYTKLLRADCSQRDYRQGRAAG